MRDPSGTVASLKAMAESQVGGWRKQRQAAWDTSNDPH